MTDRELKQFVKKLSRIKNDLRQLDVDALDDMQTAETLEVIGEFLMRLSKRMID